MQLKNMELMISNVHGYFSVELVKIFNRNPFVLAMLLKQFFVHDKAFAEDLLVSIMNVVLD